MSIEFRTALASILRRLSQGILNRAEAYHAICNLYLEVPHHEA